jgi:hypothetical protein
VQLPVKAIVVVAVVLLVVAWGVLSSSGPSEDLARARELRAAVEELEKEDKLAEALASARELASLRKATDQEEVTTLADWGESRVGILHMGVARAELDAFKEGLSDIEALDAATLAARKEELARLAAKHADLPSMTKSVDRLMEKIDARLARVKAERGEVEEDARLATLSAALAEARREADALMRELRFGRALAVVDRHRNEMPAELTAAFGGRFDELKEWILAGARAAYEQKEVAADNYVLNGRNEDAKKVYREVIETFGVEDLTGKAQKALKSLGAEKPRVTAAAKQDELKLVERVVALTEKMLKTMDYIGAKLEIEEATLGVKGRQAVHRLDALAERVQRDEEAFMRILDMIGKKPVRLSAIRKDGKGQISAADSAGYTVTVGDQRAGTSSVNVKAPWSRMAAGELCKLAEMAAADDVDSLVDLALFCAGRGAREEYLAARSRVMNSAEAGKNPLERFEGVLEEPKGERPGPAVDRKGVRAGEKEDEEDEKEKKEAPEDDANQEGADTGKETAPETEADTPGAPAAIDGTCPYCKGSGTVESIGCGKCRATSVDGSRHCENCAATGRASHDCRNCRGQGFLIVDGRQHECPLCRGKGHPPCDFCRGTGLVKIANPDASPVPTKPCPFCKGERYNVKFKCKSCSGSGKKLHSSTEGRIRWTMSVTCPICKGEGEGPPVCANCSAKGYVGSSNTPKLCRTCMGTGHVYPPCRACAGRGWLRAGK